VTKPEEIVYLISEIIGGFFIGGLCGSLALVLGIIRKKKLLGFIGFAISIGFGVLMTTYFYKPAFLSIIPSAVFAIIILLQTKTK